MRQAVKAGLNITTYNPGDNRKYKVFVSFKASTQDFFDGGHLFVTLDKKELQAFVEGFIIGKRLS